MSEETLYESLKISYETSINSTKGYPTNVDVSEELFKVIDSSRIIKTWITKKKIILNKKSNVDEEYITFYHRKIEMKEFLTEDDIKKDGKYANLLTCLLNNKGYNLNYYFNNNGKEFILDGEFMDLSPELYEKLRELKFESFINYLKDENNK